jgi:hypothetical protein
LAVLIACVVIGAIQSTGVSGGKLQLFDWDLSPSGLRDKY